ncbi:MAG: TonB-dependent receptor [Bryobacteraceae bacterium]
MAALTHAAAQTPAKIDLSRMEVEDLMAITVTSVSKREQKLSRTAAAVFVINQDDIRRSGATNIPDLLRMAPGVDVQQIDANAWAISVRGFNARYSNKVLVLVDGRTVYTPSFSGVYWEQIGAPLENIDRIEVVRGPGASVWGANAVNGVISIFTKSAKSTKGGLATAAAGSQLKVSGLLQYGGSAGKNIDYRIYGRYFDIGNSAMPDNSRAADHWRRSTAGFRSDWDPTTRDSVTVQGVLFANQASQTLRSNFLPTPYDRIYNQNPDAAGGNLLARWSHTLEGGSQTSFQAYYDTYRRADLGVPEVLKTFDLDFQHHIAAGSRHDIVWGLGYRVSSSGLSPGYAISFSPPSRTDSLYGGFLQDEIRVTDSFWLTLGCKLERNAYTGVQPEPNVRVAWSPPDSKYAVWAATSRAVRQPARADTALQTDLQTIPIGPDTVQVLRFYGNPLIKGEELRDFELGYRSEITKSLSLDIATFFSVYRNLQTNEPQSLVVIPGSPLRYEVPLLNENMASGTTYGGEVSLNGRVNSRWRIRPGYSYLHATLHQDPASQGLPSATIATGFPQNLLTIRSSVNLSARTEFDQSLYYTARLPGGSIPGHARLDLKLGRRLGDSAEISLVGQNLLRPRTLEFGDSQNVIGTQVVRSVYGQILWRF